MNCLPIVERELRVAARKRSTFWLRIAAAVTALVIGSLFFVLGRLQGAPPPQMGGSLFRVLSWLCLVAGLSAGLFFTSDCLSEEKREGTLGLLFLTDLRGYDVALGKLLATSLRGFYALLALLPVLAITLVMGGTTGLQFWKCALALVNGLFVSLAAGMAVSALSRDSQRALTATMGVLLLLVLGGPVADAIVAGVKHRSFEPFWSLSSPGYVLAAARAWGSSPYWSALVVTQLVGWALLALACALVPRTWQERKKAGSGHRSAWAYAWKYGRARRRLRLRRKLVDREPVAWLACRERWQAQGLWAIALLMVAGFVAVLAAGLPREAWLIWNSVGNLFLLILYVWAASQSCRFLVAARASGLLELVLATPLSERRIVAGQLVALMRMFGLPVLLLLSVHLAGTTLWQVEFQRLTTQVSTQTSSVVTNRSGRVTSRAVVVRQQVNPLANANTNTTPASRGLPAARRFWQRTGMALAAALVSALSTAANLLALCWFGMWMGLTSKTANLATLKTLLFVQVVPWFVISFGSGIVVATLMPAMMMRGARGPSTAWFTWWPLLSAFLTAFLAMGKDVGFILWSRGKLYSSFRELAARSLGQPRLVPVRPVPATIPAPPVIVAPH